MPCHPDRVRRHYPGVGPISQELLDDEKIDLDGMILRWATAEACRVTSEEWEKAMNVDRVARRPLLFGFPIVTVDDFPKNTIGTYCQSCGGVHTYFVDGQVVESCTGCK